MINIIFYQIPSLTCQMELRQLFAHGSLGSATRREELLDFSDYPLIVDNIQGLSLHLYSDVFTTLWRISLYLQEEQFGSFFVGRLWLARL
mgnify:FL=1